MNKLAWLGLGLSLAMHSAGGQTADATRWRAEASRVAIVRDDWGIAHIHGKTDADAVFGMIYAQCEDDFNRVETNYLTSLGRMAEAEGESRIWQDLRQRLFLDPEDLKKDYSASPQWLQTLMNAWADGINFFLETHPGVKPRVLTHFEPWMALSFTEGSIGGDIERVELRKLQAFYDRPMPAHSSTSGHLDVQRSTIERSPFLASAPASRDAGTPDHDANYRALQSKLDGVSEPSGSNGIAIAPSNTINHHALLLINPHTSFFFRSELQMTSDEGLNAYGAVTWGQFFVYQGFNDRAGWMHTSSGVDAVDEFVEATFPARDAGAKAVSRYGTEVRPVVTKAVTITYRSATGNRPGRLRRSTPATARSSTRSQTAEWSRSS